MDKLKKLLTEAKNKKQQIDIIADAICEDPDINIEQLIEEGVVDLWDSMVGHMRAYAKSFLKSEPDRLLQRLSDKTGISAEELNQMSYEEKTQALLNSMGSELKEQGEDIQRGMRGMGM